MKPVDAPQADLGEVDRLRRGQALSRLARHPLRTIRSEPAAQVYAHPRQQLARLVQNGELFRVATGYYVVVPRERQGGARIPQLESVAAGIGVAAFDADSAVLMGISAARLHGAIPRAIASAVVAVPGQRRRILLLDRQAEVVFVKRRTDRLDAIRMTTGLGPALVTSVEQSILDVAHRPSLGRAEADALESLPILLRKADSDRLNEIALDQRLNAALRRVLERGRQ